MGLVLIVLYFLLFLVLFFFVGMCVSCIFVVSKWSVVMMYFYDFLVVVVGVLFCLVVMENFGGYGIIGVVLVLGMGVFICFVWVVLKK